MRVRLLISLVGLAVLLVAWGSTPRSWTRAVTFNTGLSPGYVPLVDARAEPVIDTLAGLDADVLCVQELVVPEHIAALEAATAERWPHALFFEPDPGEPLIQACAWDDLGPLLACVETYCQVPDEDLTGCALAYCGEPFAALPADCLTCLGAGVGRPLEEIVGGCLTQAYPYAYGGEFGIGLLTRGQVHEWEARPFESTITRQGALYADVSLEGFGRVHVFCIHPSAILDAVPYPGAGSWADEQAAQVADLLSFIDEKTQGRGRVLLLGDFNSGPGRDGHYEEAAVDNYLEFVDAGFENPYADACSAECTWCPDNALVADSDAPALLDHVLLRGVRRDGHGARILDETVTVDVGGTPVDLHLSDHYGLEMTLVP